MKYKSGRHFRKYCGDDKCLINSFEGKRHTEESKEKIRKTRLKFMKEHPEQTAWRKRNEPSWPEKTFENAIKKHDLLSKFEIEREKTFFPFYGDFAFSNVKVAVEIQGSQHLLKEYKERDEIKKQTILNEGWRVYYITASQIMMDPDTCIKDLLDFIGDVTNPIFSSKIKTKRDLKLEEKTKKEKIDLIKQQGINEKWDKRKKDFLEIEKTWGWINRLAIKWNLSHTQVRKIVNKF